MRIINKVTGKEVTFSDKKTVMKELYAPQYEWWSFFSPIMNALIEKYKNVPLTPYVPSRFLKKELEKHPERAKDFPKWEVKGYDKEVSHRGMELKLHNEFYNLYQQNSPIVANFINRFSQTYLASV